MLNLKPFQRRFLQARRSPLASEPSALSASRVATGRATLVAWLGARTLDPDDPLFVKGAESHIVAASIGQARRSTFKLLREFCESSEREREYSISENNQTCQVLHKPTNTRISVLASSGKTSQGLVRCPWLFADEPGSWEIKGGRLLHEAIQTAQGKPGTNLRVIYIGTLAPETSGWWHDLVSGGSHGSTHVTALRGRLAQWATARELRRVNPLMWAFPESRAALLEERDQAKADSRHKATFLGYRLNLPALDEEVALLTPDEWERVLARPVPERSGVPIVGLDLGGGRAWSAAVAVWESGRIEAMAVTGGEPDIKAREKRDRVPGGTYQRLVEAGTLIPITGLMDPDPSHLVREVEARWGEVDYVCSDWYRRLALGDAAPHWNIETRRGGWEEASEDIGGLRRQASDGCIAVDSTSRELLTWSLSVARVKPDDRGNIRLIKGDMNNQSRDDVAQAFLLAGGALDRERRRPVPSMEVVFG